MKPSTISTTVTVIWLAAAVPAFSQAPPPATEPADLPLDRPDVATGKTAPARDQHAAAELFATAAGKEAKGNLKFSMAGDAVNVSGRLEGLEGGERYQLGIHGSGPPASPAAAAAPMNEGTPNAGTPQAPQPNAGTPQAPQPNAGQPDGQERPGPAGAGTTGSAVAGGGTPPAQGATRALASGENFAVVTTDATGSVNVNALLRNVDVDGGLQAITGHTVVLRKIGGTGPIATGVITMPDEKQDGQPEDGDPADEDKTTPEAATDAPAGR